MPLEAGTKLGPYEVAEPIGAGGMGEVYRARDTKLNRDVALKVLPEAFVNEPERLARFQREAEVLASLNHPNIAQIYGLEDSGDTTALVLELVEGPTLADRIAQGAIPLDDALDIAKQISEALEAAHVVGIIHRDLKPANIKITPEGVVKVLDFGLAKAFTSNENVDPALSQSPTLTKGTAIGTIMGTAAYMSPEQAKGKPVDTRTDVWAFGAVAYEMLTGERAFKGDDVSDTLVSVFRDEPDWTKLPGDLPSRIRRAMRVCLQKDAKQRVRDVAAIRLAMEGAFETESAPALAFERSRWRSSLVVLAALVGGLVVWGLVRDGTERTGDVAVIRTSIVLPETQRLTTTRQAIAVSPTGAHVAYAANGQIYVRAMAEEDGRPLPGTERTNATVPFFSPNGQWLGFYSLRDGELAKVAITGGASVTLCSTERVYGASWGSDGTIVFGRAGGGILKVAADGGEPEPLLTVDVESGERAHGPQILPDGRSVLFTLGRDDWNEAQIVVQSLDTDERRVLVEGGTDGRYLPSGHLVFALDSNVLAVPFDLERLEVSGGPVPLVDGVMPSRTSGSFNFDVSRDGMLVYVPGRADAPRTLVWVDRDGREEPIAAEPRAYDRARISPDGTKVVVDIGDQEEDLWVWDIDRETLTRLTFDAGRDSHSEWTVDGEHVFFSSARGGVENVHRRATDGTGIVERLFESPNRQSPFTFSPDGTRLVIHDISGDYLDSFGLSVLTLDGEPVVEPLFAPSYFVDDAALSPDGTWLAYASLASGEMEVYVRPFPNVDSGVWQISTNGGRYPLWGPDGDELFFATSDGALMRVAVDASTAFRFGNLESLIDSASYFYNPRNRAFDISPDGRRFLMVKQDDDAYAGLTRIIVVQNWFEELNARVPVE